jgi:hypothetical protein
MLWSSSWARANEAGDEDLDVLLTLVDCQITYRSRYLVGPALAPVRDLAVHFKLD